MKYTKQERLEIGCRMYNGELTRYEAAEEYGINDNTARSYMRMYRDVHGLPAKRATKSAGDVVIKQKTYAPEYAEYIRRHITHIPLNSRIRFFISYEIIFKFCCVHQIILLVYYISFALVLQLTIPKAESVGFDTGKFGFELRCFIMCLHHYFG